jgi:peptide/nickel transport system ATP-binding protein
MRQRAVIAVALACGPRLMICDQLTTGLDITSSLASSATAAWARPSSPSTSASLYGSRIVMKDGEIVESGTPEALFHAPRNEYSRKLVDAPPRPEASTRSLLPPRCGDPSAPTSRASDGSSRCSA